MEEDGKKTTTTGGGVGDTFYQGSGSPSRSSSHWTPSSHLSEGRSLKETQICAEGKARPEGNREAPVVSEGPGWSRREAHVVSGAARGRLRRGGRPRALLPGLSAPPSGHVTPPSTRSVAQRAVAAALPPRPPFFSRCRPAGLPPPNSIPTRANHRSSSRAPAPPLSSRLSHWPKPQGRVPRAGGHHWWAEPAEFPDEGTFCGIKGARKAGDGAV